MKNRPYHRSALRRITAGLAACLLLSAPLAAKPLKVFILAGQSNMTGMAKTRTLEHVKMFPETAKQFEAVFTEDGSPVVLDEVYVSCWPKGDVAAMGPLAPRFGAGVGEADDSFGPEYGFGIYLHLALQEPILIIKTAQGGQNLYDDFRPPSAGEWTPTAGHPDLAPGPKPVPLPETVDLPDGYLPSEEVAEEAGRNTGKFLGIVGGLRGIPMEAVNGIHPIYLVSRHGKEKELPGEPFRVGDLILGVNGGGLREDPIEHWREAYQKAKAFDADWTISFTRWRDGKIETVKFDIAETIKGGRARLPEYIARVKAKAEKDKGNKYRKMVEHVKTVLENPGHYHPAYDPKVGYEIAGFVWFQGYNDLVAKGVYPSRDKPRGYEQYTWLLEHLIRDLRKDLNAPDMPVVIGVMGIGGIATDPEDPMTHFQAAQAATAMSPEFKDSVAALQTGQFWDHELADLIARSERVNRKMGELKKQEDLDGDERQAAFAAYRARHITPQEEKVLDKAVSNQGFHYYGSAKIMLGIGRGFAETWLERLR